MRAAGLRAARPLALPRALPRAATCALTSRAFSAGAAAALQLLLAQCGRGRSHHRHDDRGWRAGGGTSFHAPLLGLAAAVAVPSAAAAQDASAESAARMPPPQLTLPLSQPSRAPLAQVRALRRRHRTPLRVLLARAWRHLRAEAPWLLASAVLAVASAALGVGLPVALGAFWDAFQAAGSSGELLLPGLRLAAMQAAKLLLALNSSAVLVASSERAAAALRADLFRSLVADAPLALFDARDAGSIAAALGDDVKDLRDLLRAVLSEGLPAAARVLGAAGSLWTLSPPLTVGLAAALPALVAAGSAYAAGLRRLAALSAAAQAEAGAAAAESLAAVKVVRAYTGEDVEAARYEALLAASSRASIAVGTSVALFNVGAAAALAAVAGGVSAGGAVLVSSGHLTRGGLAAFLGQTLSLQGGLEALAALGGKSARTLGGAGTRLGRLLIQAEADGGTETPATAKHDASVATAAVATDAAGAKAPSPVPGSITLPHLRGEVIFSDVTFTYPTRPQAPALRGLTLRLAPGSVTALVGPSGSGKSSVAALLLGLYPLDDGTRRHAEGVAADGAAGAAQQPATANAGAITVDGVPLPALAPRWYRAHTALVPQEPALFNASLRENLAYGVAGQGDPLNGSDALQPARPRHQQQPGVASSLLSVIVKTLRAASERGGPSFGGRRSATASDDADAPAATAAAAADAASAVGSFPSEAARRRIAPAPPSDATLMAAAQAAHVADFIRSLPSGLDTPCGDRGATLSGGQRQRIAIARALLRRPRILVLDEATSALDAEAEAALGEALAGGFGAAYSGGASAAASQPLQPPQERPTVLLIAHRLSTCRHADSIIVMDRGRVVEQGSHEELMAKPGGLYARLVARQTGAAAAGAGHRDGFASPASAAAGSAPPPSLEQQLDELLAEEGGAGAASGG